MIKEAKIIYNNGKQYIPNLRKAVLKPPFRGRPEISLKRINEQALVDCCPLGAIDKDPVRIDLGKCAFCGECAFAFPDKIKFTADFKTASNKREDLIVTEGVNSAIKIVESQIRPIIRKTFSKSIKLRQVSAGGDNSCEMELGACGNANFDMGRYGIEFTASPRHADGIVLTGPITENMAEALHLTYEAIPEPKVLILCGIDAISGGIFAESKALNRSFLKDVKVDLYIPGNPTHPLTFINAILDLTRGRVI